MFTRCLAFTRFLACLTAVTLCLACADSQAAQPLKGLLISGGCCHDYVNQAKIITEGISQRANIEWTMVHEDDGREHEVSTYKNPNWAMGYDVIVHNECYGGVKNDEFVKGIAKAHFKGTPAIFIHCSLHSYRNATDGAEMWRELIGVTSRSHEGKRSVKVKRLDVDHPVLTDFPKEWDTPNGELYKIEKVWPNCTPLAQAYGKDTDKDHTVIWVNKFGKARVFGTSLGHHNETMNNDVWLGLVARGLLWTCDKLDDEGNPVDGYAGTGIQPIELPEAKPQPDPKFSSPKKAGKKATGEKQNSQRK